LYCALYSPITRTSNGDDRLMITIMRDKIIIIIIQNIDKTVILDEI